MILASSVFSLPCEWLFVLATSFRHHVNYSSAFNILTVTKVGCFLRAKTHFEATANKKDRLKRHVISVNLFGANLACIQRKSLSYIQSFFSKTRPLPWERFWQTQLAWQYRGGVQSVHWGGGCGGRDFSRSIWNWGTTSRHWSRRDLFVFGHVKFQVINQTFYHMIESMKWRVKVLLQFPST